MVQAKTTSRRSRRQGFTLIELLIVIAVIAVLAALLLPAIGNARTNVRITGVRNEITQLDSAIASFKAAHGIEPPSSIVLCEQSVNWSQTTTGVVNSIAIIRQLWPQYDFTTDHDINGDGVASDPVAYVDPTTSTNVNGFALTPGECLVFFLGGVNGSTNPGTTTSNNNIKGNIGPCTGFSKSPQSPFDRGGSREAPLFDFFVNRFTDVNANGFPEYMDNLPGQTTPYLYYSSYDGQGYIASEFLQSPVVQPITYGLTTYYAQATGGNAQPWKPTSHQIISPGFDRQYGAGGAYTPGSNPTIPGTRTYEADNITNFSNGVLQP
jgi:prepilin-type N-terminal cleavage/methylation domain-containing protein